MAKRKSYGVAHSARKVSKAWSKGYGGKGLKLNVFVHRSHNGGYSAEACVRTEGRVTRPERTGSSRCTRSHAPGQSGSKTPTLAVKKALEALGRRLAAHDKNTRRRRK